ncbi:MAG: hypothetical protein M1819_001053 [Sarea resinae]|nr:MAG: hypothetical protein M1819_001053 [Sarea resinae]
MAHLQDKNAVILTERLHLRTIHPKDLPEIYTIRSLEPILRTSSTLTTTLEDARVWIGDMLERVGNGQAFTLVIEERHDDAETAKGDDIAEDNDKMKVIGILAAPMIPHVGFCLHTDYWGKGYATEALRAFLPYYFRQVPSAQAEGGFDFMEAQTYPDNEKSMNVLQKVGFRFVERRERAFNSPLLGFQDAIVWRFARPDSWEAA